MQKLLGSLVALFLLAGLAAASTTTFSNLEDTSGWHWCSACAKAGGGATMSLTQGLTSPSLDGTSAKFSLGGTTPWSHALYYKNLSTNGTATNFVYEVHFYHKTPKASSGMEFSVSQRKGYQWYRFDTQCSYLNGNWRLWNNQAGHWYDTSIPCPRPTAYTWTTVVIEGKRTNGKTLFVSLTVNGVKHYLNKAFYPLQMSTSNNGVKMHFQLNGNATQTDYSVWGDKFKVTYW